MSDFQIHTERLLVRRFTPMDGSDFAGILTDPETVYYEPYEILTREQAVAEAAMLAHNPAFYAVELKASGKLIGKLYLKNQNFLILMNSAIHSTGITGEKAMLPKRQRL